MKNKKVEDEIKFDELLKNPLRLFGWLYPYFFLVILVIGIFYVQNMDDVSFNTIPVSHIDSLNVDRDIEQKKGGMRPAVDLEAISNPTEELVSKGKELYDANCQSCHGADGKGDGPAGVALNPPPRNFHNADGWTNGRTFPDMYKTLQEGIIQNGMAAYEYLPPSDRVALIHYVRTFNEFPKVTEAQVEQLDATYSLSAGTMIPNQIPVKKSMTLIREDFKNTIESEAITKYLQENENSAGAQLLQNYSKNLGMVLEYNVNSDGYDNLDDFITTVSLAPNDLGFKASVVNINRGEWESIYNYLQGLANTKKS